MIIKNKFFSVFILILLLFTFLSAKNSQGRKLFQKKGCSKCHGINGTGTLNGPDISGMTFEYYYQTLLDIKSKKFSDIYPVMSNYISSVGESEIRIISRYLSGI